MKNLIPHLTGSGRRIPQPVTVQPTHWEQQPEAIIHALGTALKRCFELGRQEAR